MNLLNALFMKIHTLEDLAIKYRTLPQACRWVVRNIKYTGDQDKHGVNDYWQAPQETFDSQTGDCEDIAVLMAYIGDLLNYHTKIYVIQYWEGGKQQSHAICVFYHGRHYYHASNWGVVKTKAQSFREMPWLMGLNLIGAFEYNPLGVMEQMILPPRK